MNTPDTTTQAKPTPHQGNPERPSVTLRRGGHDVIIDEADLPLLHGRAISINSTGRNGRLYARVMLGGKYQKVHRLILGLTDSKIHTDHVNGNTLDNRRCNLRACGQKQNVWNSKKIRQESATSRFKGVYKIHNRQHSFSSSVTCNGKRVKFGRFFDEIAAALAYDIGAVVLHGEFARPNFSITEAALIHPQSLALAIERCKRKGILPPQELLKAA